MQVITLIPVDTVVPMPKSELNYERDKIKPAVNKTK